MLKPCYLGSVTNCSGSQCYHFHSVLRHGRGRRKLVLFVKGCGAKGVFNNVIVDLDPPVAEGACQRGPEVLGVGEGFACGALREVSAADACERGMDAAKDRGVLCGAHGFAQLRSCVARANVGLNAIEQGDLLEQPVAGAQGAFARFIDGAALKLR